MHTNKNYLPNEEIHDAFYKNPTKWMCPHFKIKFNDLKPFQKQVLESGNTYNDIDINLLINFSGNIGKTTIVEYIDYGNHGIRICSLY